MSYLLCQFAKIRLYDLSLYRCAGFVTPIVYYYPVFFFAVLVHRVSRDFERYVLDASKHRVISSNLADVSLDVDVTESMAKIGKVRLLAFRPMSSPV